MAITGELTPFNFAMHSGDDQVIQATAKDLADAVVDLTGALVEWGVYLDPFEGAEQFSKSATEGGAPSSEITFPDAVNGRFDIAIDAADTASLAGRYYHEAQITLAAKKRTVLVGRITIRTDRIIT